MANAASTTSIGLRLRHEAIGTSQEPFTPMTPAGWDAPLITSQSAITDANKVGGYDLPNGTTLQCVYRQLGAASSVKLLPYIGHATTPAAKTATLYVVHVHEFAPKDPTKTKTYHRTVVGSIALTGAASGGNLAAQILTAHSDVLGSLATWAPCDMVATSYLPGAGIEIIGGGATPNHQIAAWDAWGANFIEVWCQNGAASQGVALFMAQC